MTTSNFPTFSTDHARSPFDLRRPYAPAIPLARRLSASQVNLRGTAVAPVKPFVVREFGAGGWQTFLDGLDPEARAVAEQPIIATNWYPYTVCQSFIDGMVRVASGRGTVLREFAIYNLDYATSVVFRAIFKIGSPEFMVARSDQVWKKLYSHGKMKCDVVPGRARVELHDFPVLSANYARLLTHSMEAVLLKAGARMTRVEQTRSTLDGDRFSEFRYEWA
jgi:hypothetical protein